MLGGRERADRHDRVDIADWLEQAAPGLVACEPTGGYERALLAALRERGIAFVRVHPNQLIAFRTDRIDARLILGWVSDGMARNAVRACRLGDDGLRELAARRQQLIATLHAERCRRAVAGLAGVRRSLEGVIAALVASLAAIEAEIAATIAGRPELRQGHALL